MGKISDFIDGKTINLMNRRLASLIGPCFEEQRARLVASNDPGLLRLFALDEKTIQLLAGLFYGTFHYTSVRDNLPHSPENAARIQQMEREFLRKAFGTALGDEAFLKLMKVDTEKSKTQHIHREWLALGMHLYEIVGRNDPSRKPELQSKLQEIADRIVNRDFERAEVYYQNAAVKGRGGDLHGAVFDLTTATRLKPDFADAYRDLGSLHLLLNEPERALSFFTTALNLNPTSVESYLGRGQAKADSGSHLEAISDFTEAIKLFPILAEAHLAKGKSQCALERYHEGITDFTEAIRWKPDLSEAFYGRGLAYLMIEQKGDALKDLEQAKVLGHPVQEQLFAACALSQGDSESQAKTPSSLFTKATEMYAKGDLRGVVANLNQAISLKPDYTDAFIARGIAKGDLGEIDLGLFDLGEAIRLSPGNPDAYFWRANLRGRVKDYHGAIADYTNAIGLKADFADAFFNRGLSNANVCAYKEAVLDYDKALAIKPEALSYHSRGMAKFYLKEYQGAISDLGKAIELKPNLAESYCLRGKIKALVNNPLYALGDLNKAIELKPDYAEAYNLRGYSQIANSERRKALDDFKKAIELGYTVPEEVLAHCR